MAGDIASYWDPRILLDIDPDGPFTYAGRTRDDYRCENLVNYVDRDEASKLLDKIAAISPRGIAFSELLDLAELTLCKRWHRELQGPEVASVWFDIINEAYPSVQSSVSKPSCTSRQTSFSNPGTAAPPLATVPTPSSRPDGDEINDAAASIPTSPTSTAAPVSPQLTPVSPLSLKGDEDEPETITTPQSSTTPIATPPSSCPQTPSTSTSRTTTTSTKTTTITTTVTTTSTPSTATPRISTPPPPPTTAPPNTWQPLTPEASPKPSDPSSSSSSVRRRKPALDTTCPICDEDIPCPDDAIWCRAQCGTNLHRACFALWRRECLDREAPVTCVYCRAVWKDEWEV